MKGPMRLFILLAVAAMFTACSSDPKGDKADASDAKKVETPQAAAEYSVESATVNWEGSKVGGKHTGTITVTDGTLNVKDGNIAGGKLNLDMSSLTVTDLAEDQGKGKLEGHLKSPDFFDVATYPTAVFEVTGATALNNDSTATHIISGNLTMKDVTKNISFKANVKMDGNNISAQSPQFVIDRTQWGVKYGSGSLPDVAKDKAINDKVGLAISLKAVAKTDS